MKRRYLACFLTWLSVFSVAPPLALAEPAAEADSQGAEEVQEGLGEVEDYKNGFIFGEFGYSFVPGSDIVEHEISDSYLGAYFF